MLVDINIGLIITLCVGAISAIYGVHKLGKDVLYWFGKTSVSDIKIEELPDDSPIKMAFDEVNEKLDNQEKVISSLYTYARDNRAYQLRMEIRFAIEHDFGKAEVRRLYEVYKSIPSENKQRNGHIQAEVEEYIVSVNKKQGIHKYYKYQNGDVKK